jgi:hypothetical protein
MPTQRGRITRTRQIYSVEKPWVVQPATAYQTPRRMDSRRNIGFSSLFTVMPCIVMAVLRRLKVRERAGPRAISQSGMAEYLPKRKTRPGGQPDGSSCMGTWGRWALAPNTALWGGITTPTDIGSREGRRTFKRRCDFFKLFQQGILDGNHRAAGRWASPTAVLSAAMAARLDLKPWSRGRPARPEDFPRQAGPKLRIPGSPARELPPRPRHRYRPNRRRTDRRDRRPRDRGRYSSASRARRGPTAPAPQD